MPSTSPCPDGTCWPRNRRPPPASACCRARAPPLPPSCSSSSPPASCPSTGDRNPAATPGSPKPMNPSAAHSSRWPITRSREGARSWFSTTPTPPTTIFCSPCSASPSVTNPSRCVTPRLRPPPPRRGLRPSLHLHQPTTHPTALCPVVRSEEHTSELQSLRHLVCRLLLEKKKK